EEQGIEGLGGGDAKLMALIGGLLGWQALPFAMGLGSMLGVAVAGPRLLMAWLRARREGKPEEPPPQQQQQPGDEGAGEEQRSLGEMEIPFGPFLIAGALGWLFL